MVFKAQVLIGIEPVNIRDLKTIMKSPTFVERGKCPVGMLQVLDVAVSADSPAVVKDRLEYSQLRASLDATGKASIPILIIELAHLKLNSRLEYQIYGNVLTSEFGASLTEPNSTISIPTIGPPGIQGEVTKPRTADTCIE